MLNYLTIGVGITSRLTRDTAYYQSLDCCICVSTAFEVYFRHRTSLCIHVEPLLAAMLQDAKLDCQVPSSWLCSMASKHSQATHEAEKPPRMRSTAL